MTERLWQHRFTDPLQWQGNRKSIANPSDDGSESRSTETHGAKATIGQAPVNSEDYGLVDGISNRKASLRPGALVNASKSQKLRDNNGWEMLTLEETLTSVERTPQLPSLENFICILQKCRKEKNLAYAKRLHDYMCKKGLEGHRYLGNYLVPVLVECGSMCDALQVFEKLLDPKEYSWTSLITGYVECGESQQALNLYQKMQKDCVHPSKYTFVALLKACARLKDAKRGHEIHAEIAKKGLERDRFLGSTLVDMYAKCGSLAKAQETFDKLSVQDVVSWNSLIGGYAQHGRGEEALLCFQRMQAEGVLPDAVTFLGSLKACGNIGAINRGREIHTEIAKMGLERDPFLGSTLVDMYAKCGSLARARKVFDKLTIRGVVSWNALIAGYAQHGLGDEALSCMQQMRLEGVSPNVVSWNALIAGYSQCGFGEEVLHFFKQMQLDGLFPNAVTYICSLKACGSVGAIDMGCEIHAEIARKGLEQDPFVGNSLVDMYAKCGSLAKAHDFFDKLPVQDVVSWNALVAGYAQHGLVQEALNCFHQMQLEGVSPDAVTFVCSLKSCGSSGALEKGDIIHAEIARKGLDRDCCVGNALVDMYAKYGFLAKAWETFDRLLVRDVVSWNALIAGYAQHGLCEEALNCFHWMELEGVFPDVVSWNALIAGYVQLGESEIVFLMFERMIAEGITPNGITFLSVLTVCSHVGLVDKGQKYFEAMIKDYGIIPTLEHHTCLIDLFGRAGHLDEVVLIVKKMPFQPDIALWHSVLGACQKWGNVEFGRQAFEHAVQLDERDTEAYVLMSNIYADAHMLEGMKRVEALKVKGQAWKEPQQSWTVVAGDARHSQRIDRCSKLENFFLTR